MPRFTIGSIATGVALFVLVLAVWTAWSERQRQLTRTAATTSPDGRVMAGAVDPATGTVVLDGPNDLSLEDDGDWSGGLAAGGW